MVTMLLCIELCPASLLMFRGDRIESLVGLTEACRGWGSCGTLVVWDLLRPISQLIGADVLFVSFRIPSERPSRSLEIR